MKKIIIISLLGILVIHFFNYNNYAAAASLIEQLKGYILLQVEEHGEAWYVDIDSEKRYYLEDGGSAYIAMRQFGLGITNSDLEKIPVGIEDRFQYVDSDDDDLANSLEEALGTNSYNPDSDGDGFLDGMEVRNGYNPLGSGKIYIDYDLIRRVKGRILLQVESRGEAWYIYPEDGRRYYMENGYAAYQIMRFLSLGITNNDIAKIDIGYLDLPDPKLLNDYVSFSKVFADYPDLDHTYCFNASEEYQGCCTGKDHCLSAYSDKFRSRIFPEYCNYYIKQSFIDVCEEYYNVIEPAMLDPNSCVEDIPCFYGTIWKCDCFTDIFKFYSDLDYTYCLNNVSEVSMPGISPEVSKREYCLFQYLWFPHPELDKSYCDYFENQSWIESCLNQLE